MICKHCKKEEETITIGGKTFCANCSTLLKEDGTKKQPEQKIPKMSFTDNEIRTAAPQKEDKLADAADLPEPVDMPKSSLDELEGSAILLDILKDNAKENLDKKTFEEDKKILAASGDVLEKLKVENGVKQGNEGQPAQKSEPMGIQAETRIAPAAPPLRQSPEPKRAGNTQAMNDIRPAITKRSDRPGKKEKRPLEKAEEMVKKDFINLEAPLITQEGYTKEYDLMIISFVVTAIVLVVLALFLALR